MLILAAWSPSCGDDGKKTARACDGDEDCAGGVCFEEACYKVCEDQDDCVDDEVCVRKAGASGAMVNLCLTAAAYVGCTGADQCSELVAGPCEAPFCRVGEGGCAVAAVNEGAECIGAAGLAGTCADGECLVPAPPADLGGEDVLVIEPAVEVVDVPAIPDGVPADPGAGEAALEASPEAAPEPIPEPADEVVEVAPVDTAEVTLGPVYHDLATELMWVRADAAAQDQVGAVAWCDALVLEGFDDWRLPTISELRTTIAGCPGSMSGGACLVADPGCLASSCWSSSPCSCPLAGGPGEGGFYWEPGVWMLVGGTLNFWSSSVVSNDTGNGWVLFPRNGGVDAADKDDYGLVRCVRTATGGPAT